MRGVAETKPPSAGVRTLGQSTVTVTVGSFTEIRPAASVTVYV
jgi:hypothetical protein